jgi:Flp pilus assembly protein TadG
MWSQGREPRPGQAAFRDRRSRGQSLAELALILPILLMLVGGIIQYGTVMATQHTLIQIGRDLGRWAATQTADDCTDLGQNPSPIAARAHQIATQSSLMAYAGDWAANFTSYGYGAIPATQPAGPGVEVAWSKVSGECPPEDSTTAAFVTLRLAHEAPVLLPGLAYLPGLGTCSGGRCFLLITTTAQFRMEPQAQPEEGGS